MPPSYVKTVDALIFYYYSKLVIARSAGLANNYGFITDRFKKLKSGEIRMSDYDREIRDQMETGMDCVYCGDNSNTMDHVIPRIRGGPESMHNVVKSCQKCNSSKGDMDLVDWWINHQNRSIDDLPRIPIGIYLKLSYDWHKIKHTLEMPAASLFDLRPFD